MTDWHVPTPSTRNQHGDEVHPAFGSIQAQRHTVTPGSVLFDSDLRHSQTIVVTVEGMRRNRDLNHDWLHADGKVLVEVEMSEAQWASFVSSIGTSGAEAVPVGAGSASGAD